MRVLVFVIAIAFFCSCSSIYIPQAPNIPLHKEKGETTVNTGLNTNSFVFNGSHSITDKYALIGGVNISYGNISNYNDLGDLLHSGGELTLFDGGIFKHYISEIGFGKYKPFSEHGVFELYTGAGYGKSFTSNKSYINKYGNFYFQTNIGIRKSRFELGGMLKINGSYMNYQYIDYYDIIHKDNIPVLSIQTGGVLKVGGEKVKFWVSPSINYSHAFINTNYEDMELDLNFGKFYTFGNLTIGINCRF